MTLDLSVIIPAYNEEQRIGPTIDSLHAFLAVSGLSYEIVVVDDGSSDNTVGLVHRIAENMPTLRCIESRPNRGKGHVVRVGMLAASGAIRLMTDADGSTAATEIPKLVNAIRVDGVDVAIGSRYSEGASCGKKQPFYRVWWSRAANYVVQRTVVRGIKDTQCGFKAFTAEAAEATFRLTTIDGWAFDLEALALASRMGFSIRECAVHWTDDERSRINPLGDAWRVVKELFQIRRNLRRGVYFPHPSAAICCALRRPSVSHLPK